MSRALPSKEEHNSEMQRRAELMKNTLPSGEFFEKAAGIGDDPPFKDDDQEWVLFSVSHEFMNPRSVVRNQPALRIYGCFASQEDAQMYASTIMANDTRCNIQLNKTHEWILACRCEDNLRDAEYVSSKTKRLLKIHESRILKSKEEFKENVESMQEDGKVKISEKLCPKFVRETEKGKKQTLPQQCQLVDQTMAVLSFVQDDDKESPEFLFNVYACTRSDVEADRYVRNVLSLKILDHDIDVVSTGKWIFPTVELENVKNEYRSPELTKIMENHRTQPQKVEQFKTENEK